MSTDPVADLIARNPEFFANVRYFGPDDGRPRHDWCRADNCIACGCTREAPCISHTEARGYRDWVRR